MRPIPSFRYGGDPPIFPGHLAVDPRLLLVAELLLAPVGVAIVLLMLFRARAVHHILMDRQRRPSKQPASSV